MQSFAPSRVALVATLSILLCAVTSPGQKRGGISTQPRPRPLNPSPADNPVVPAKPEVRPAVPIRPAEPMAPNPNAPNPLEQNPMPVRKALVIDDTSEKKTPPPPPPPPAPTGQPRSDKEDQLEYANLVYSYEHFDLAIRQFEKFLASYPSEPESEAAWYRIGECYLNEGNKTKAENAYREQLRRFPLGEYAPAGSYRLGALSYENQDFKTAEMNFHIAEARSKEREIKLSAAFYRARSLDALSRYGESAPVYESILKIADDNPYREASLLYLARNAFDGDKTEEALKRFTELTKTATTPAIKSEALVKAGLLLSEKGDTAPAAEFLGEALELPDKDPWKPFAYYALVQNQYNAGEYEKVVSTYKTEFTDLPDETRAKLLLMVGNAHRKLGRHDEAIEKYNLVEKYYAEFTEGQEAGYRKLLCAHDNDDPNLLSYVDYYVERQGKLAPQLRYIDMALMLKAEILFAKADYVGAAAAYSEVRPANIADELRPTRLYKLGWSFSESGNAARAVDVLTDFIVLNPDDPLTPSALAQRASSYRKLENTPAAVADFMKITSRFPRSEAAEFAWQQLALSHGQNREFEKMIFAFESLLKNFPETKGAAEAHYWTGYGRFELKQWKEALASLDKARELDAGNYHERATLRMVLAYYYLQDGENLHKEADHFLNTKPSVTIPPNILAWLGVDLFSKEDYEESERFLAMASDPENPKHTRGEVWNHLAKARIQIEKYPEAVTALDFYLDTLTKPSSRARALLDKSIAQLGMKKFDASLESAKDALTLEKQGRVNAMIRMQLGDIAMERNRYEDAAREYIIISEIFLDPEITPRAMLKAAQALEKSGDNAKAESLRENLRKQFPDFKVAS